MKSKRTEPAKKEVDRDSDAFLGRENFKWMLVGGAVMILGFILMAGGKSDDPRVFNEDEVYSARRITIAPLLILAGFIIEVIAIFRQPKRQG